MKEKNQNSTLSDLNDYLFEQLADLNNPDATREELDTAIKRSEAITNVASTIIQNAELSLKAIKIISDSGAKISIKNIPPVLGLIE